MKFDINRLKLADGFDIAGITPNPLLTQYLSQWSYENFIADRLLMPVKVPNRFFRLQLINQGPYRIPDGKTKPRGAVNQIAMTVAQEEHKVQDVYLEHPIDREEQEEAGSLFDLESEAADFVFTNVKLIHEKDTSALLADPANYTTTINGGGGGFIKWDQTTATIEDNVDELIAGCDTPPNIGYTSYLVWRAMRKNENLKKSILGTVKGGPLTTQSVADYFGLDSILVGQEKYNAAAEGDADSIQFIWPDIFGVAYLKKPSRQGGTFAAVFSQKLASARTFFMPYPGPEGADFCRAGWNREFAIMNKSRGALAYDLL